MLLNCLKHTRKTAKRNSYTDTRESGSDCRGISLKSKNAYQISTTVENLEFLSE